MTPQEIMKAHIKSHAKLYAEYRQTKFEVASGLHLFAIIALSNALREMRNQ